MRDVDVDLERSKSMKQTKIDTKMVKIRERCYLN